MSGLNLAQVYAVNPVTTIGATDLLYIDVGGTTDGAINGSHLLGLFPSSTLSSGKIYVGSAGNVATAQSVSGDAALSNVGALTVSKIGGVGISLAGAFTQAGAFATTLTSTGITNATLPVGTTTLVPTTGTGASGTWGINISGNAATATAIAVGGITGLGTGVATALAINVGSAGAFVTFNGAGGTPSSMVGTNITGTAAGLTAGTASAVAVGGITGLGTGVATALAANVNGSGAIVLTTSPTLVTPTLGAALATSINFGGTSLANYVQGSWTPVFTSSGGGTATYSTQTGTYTRIGNRVFFNMFVVLTALPSAGTVTIAGLPLAIASYGSSSVYATALQATATTQIMTSLNAGGTVITLYFYAAGTATQLTVANCSTTSQFIISGQYDV